MNKELQPVVNWTDKLCDLIEQRRRKGDYSLLERMPPAVKCYLQERVWKSGPQHNAALWRALHPGYWQDLELLRAAYLQEETSPAPAPEPPAEPPVKPLVEGYATVSTLADHAAFIEGRTLAGAILDQLSQVSVLTLAQLDQIVDQMQARFAAIQADHAAPGGLTLAEMHQGSEIIKSELLRRKAQEGKQ